MPTGIFYVRKGRNGSRNGTRTSANDFGRTFENGRIRANQMRAEVASKRRDQFAELLAEGATPTEAARAMGASLTTGRDMLRRICEGLGILDEPPCAGDFVHPVKGK